MDTRDWMDCSDGAVKGYEWWCYTDNVGVEDAPAVRRYLPSGNWEVWDINSLDFIGALDTITTAEEAKAYALVMWRMGGGDGAS